MTTYCALCDVSIEDGDQITRSADGWAHENPTCAEVKTTVSGAEWTIGFDISDKTVLASIQKEADAAFLSAMKQSIFSPPSTPPTVQAIHDLIKKMREENPYSQHGKQIYVGRAVYKELLKELPSQSVFMAISKPQPINYRGVEIVESPVLAGDEMVVCKQPPTVPFVLGSGDTFSFTFKYEAT